MPDHDVDRMLEKYSNNLTPSNDRSCARICSVGPCPGEQTAPACQPSGSVTNLVSPVCNAEAAAQPLEVCQINLVSI